MCFTVCPHSIPSFEKAIREIVEDPKQHDVVLSGHGGTFKEKVDTMRNEKEAADALESSRPTFGTPEQVPGL